ncbi:MAG: hypothetical protein WCO56_20525 [Verrucomicrobiota bacterium]
MFRPHWRLSLAVLLAITTACAVDVSPLGQLVFEASMQAGYRDQNGKLVAGTEVMHLVPHAGKLYASTSLWMEKDPAVPKACQVLVLDSPKGQWRVERQFTVNNLRYGSLKEVTFSTDALGHAIAPVSLLLAVPDVRSGPLTIYCREDKTGEWSASELGTVSKYATTRAIGLHRDRVTGIDRVFAGTDKLGMIGGVYDPAAPGRIRWEKQAEFQTPEGERVMGFCRCNGVFYCATSRHIYQRTDGTSPSWKEVYFCPKETSPCGIRGLSAVPKPGGGGEVLWCAALSKARRLDPADGFNETIELDIPVFLTEKLGVKVTFALSAYNELMPYVVPGTGEIQWLFGFECCHPAAGVNSHPRIKARVQMKENPRAYFSGQARYCIRHAQGANITYEVAEVTDPREPQLVSTRVTVVSPFPEDHGKVLYFGGYDCNSVPSHHTAWIYRGVPAIK